MRTIQKHIRCSHGDIGKYAFIPGHPGRAKKIAEAIGAEPLVTNREYTLFTGFLDGAKVTICSTGIGGPSASIAVEELARLGCKVFIRVGSAGGRQEDIPIGSIVIATAAFRGDGTSRAYAPIEFPAVADLTITNALIDACKRLGYQYYVGVVYSRDAYYVQNEDLNRFLKDAGVVAAEQECATIFILGAVRRLRVGAILATDSNIWIEKQRPLSLEEKEKMFLVGEEKAITAAVEAMRTLIRQETGGGHVVQ